MKKTITIIVRYFLRLIALPFFAGLTLVGMTATYLKYLLNFMLHGGEAIAYVNGKIRPSIADVFDELTKQRALKSQPELQAKVRELETIISEGGRMGWMRFGEECERDKWVTRLKEAVEELDKKKYHYHFSKQYPKQFAMGECIDAIKVLIMNEDKERKSKRVAE